MNHLWSVFIKVSCVLKRNVYSLSVQYDIIFKSIMPKLIIILLKSSLSITEMS